MDRPTAQFVVDYARQVNFLPDQYGVPRREWASQGSYQLLREWLERVGYRYLRLNASGHHHVL